MRSTRIRPAVSMVRPTSGLHTTWWTDKKEKALRLTLEGLPLGEIARRVRVHRNSLSRWKADPHFQQRLTAEVGGRSAATRLRRIAEASALTDHLAAHLERVMAGLRVDPGDEKLLRDFRVYSEEWRCCVRAERELFVAEQAEGQPAVKRI